MDLGPILEAYQRDDGMGVVRFDGVTVYDKKTTTTYHFHGQLAAERAQVWAAKHGGEYVVEKGTRHVVRRPKAAE
jgi:hypothetical protein